MSLFLIGQKVVLSNSPEIVYVITAINADSTYQIRYDCSSLSMLNFDNVSAEMLRSVQETE